MLGGGWSQVIRIDNEAHESSYPSTVYALVFEEGGLLWFYTDSDGTQSLSLHRNRLAEERDDLGTLLRAIDPGFVHFTELEPELRGSRMANDPLPNGCFVECVGALRERIMLGDRIEEARLLSCYANTRRGLRGHTVATYRTPAGFFMLDPTASKKPHALPSDYSDKPEAIAALALEGAKVAKARWVPTDRPESLLVARATDAARRMSRDDEAAQSTE
jgi:hypothetical protein